MIVRWDNGRQSVLVTNIPCDRLDAGEITKSYFDRWPFQEKQFRDTKRGVNIHRIVGYGKRSEPYEKMREQCNTLRERMQHLKLKLQEPLKEIERLENELVMLYRQERALREQSSIEAGKRVLCEDKMLELKQYERAINTCLRKKKTIENQHKEDMKKLKKYMQKERRIRLKDTVYRLDTELEQIMTCFKLSFANLCSAFLSECMNHETFELITLFESIFQLEGQAVITQQERIITLSKNPKEPNLMKKLEEAILKLNEMKMITLDGLHMQFRI